jgi:hypothetical protein
MGDDRLHRAVWVLGVPNLGGGGEVTVPNSEAFGFASLPEMVAAARTVVRGAVEDHAEVRITQRLAADRRSARDAAADGPSQIAP